MLKWAFVVIACAAAPSSGAADRAGSGSEWPLVEISRFLDDTPVPWNEGKRVRLRGTVIYMKVEGYAEMVIGNEVSGALTHWTNGADIAGLKEGMYVEVEGFSQQTNFSPRLQGHSVRILAGERPLSAVKANYEDLKSGRMECRLIEITGVVRSARVDRSLTPPRLLLGVATPAGGFEAWIQRFGEADGQALVDGNVQLRGVCLAWNNRRQQAHNLRLLVNKMEDVTLIGPVPAAAFAAPPTTPQTLMSYRREGINLHRVRLRGQVTWSSPEGSFVFQAQEYGVRVRGELDRPPIPSSGDTVEVSGFPEFMGYSAGLVSATWRVIEQGTPPAPEKTTALQILARTHHMDMDGSFVSLEGTLLSLRPQSGGVLLDLRDGQHHYQATLSGPADNLEGLSLPMGSRLELTGICELIPQQQPEGRSFDPGNFIIRLRQGGDIAVLNQGPWLTRQRLLTLCIAGAVGLSGMLVWNRSLRRTVSRRTQFLAEEIRSKHDRNVEFKAILGERERVAAELHDTVQQGLMATSLQIQAADLTLPAAPENVSHHLALARRYLERSREDLRRSVWDLHEPAGSPQNLTMEITKLTEALKLGDRVSLTVDTEGFPFPLREQEHHEIMRMTGELLANAVRHSGGKTIVTGICYGAQGVTLTVRDDGAGFDPGKVEGPDSGHFGLSGLRERARRIGAEFTIASQPGAGTTGTVWLRYTHPRL